ncbi:unnamed protein product [Prorocentrum cordatum]|uniref:Secreted protein n=1 Tax=Prorocentrum cordatum TaxID=2364126 RepID=A0ABN9TZC8_9DINO|nr:unnamed protein product [Polarella glacialis]
MMQAMSVPASCLSSFSSCCPSFILSSSSPLLPQPTPTPEARYVACPPPMAPLSDAELWASQMGPPCASTIYNSGPMPTMRSARRRSSGASFFSPAAERSRGERARRQICAFG